MAFGESDLSAGEQVKGGGAMKDQINHFAIHLSELMKVGRNEKIGRHFEALVGKPTLQVFSWETLHKNARRSRSGYPKVSKFIERSIGYPWDSSQKQSFTFHYPFSSSNGFSSDAISNLEFLFECCFLFQPNQRSRYLFFEKKTSKRMIILFYSLINWSLTSSQLHSKLTKIFGLTFP